MSISLKLVAVGDGAVGKTSMLICYTKNEFPDEYVPTVFDNFSTSVTLNDQVISLAIWDTAGQEEYESIRPLSYPGADIFLLCFSVVQPTSLDNIVDKWYPEVKQHCPASKTMIVGLKIDLRDSMEELKKLEARNKKPLYITDIERVIETNALDCDGYSECSAKTQKGLQEEVMQTAVKLCVGGASEKQVPIKHEVKEKKKGSEKVDIKYEGIKEKHGCCILF
ncbi:Rho family GTPase [Entamoeba marina]